MILNVSGRTDVVAFYSRWFMNRYKEGFLDVRNPFYANSVSRIFFKDVDLIVFCTKNPNPIIDYLKDIDIPILFQVTLTPYLNDVELNVINKNLVIDGIKKVSEILGSDNVYVRYDPIFVSDKYDINYHVKAFDKMCSLLNGFVKRVIVSFIDDYKNVRANKCDLNYREFSDKDYEIIGRNFSRSAYNNGMTVQTCAEEEDLVKYGFVKDDCVSKMLAKEKTGKNFKSWKSRNNKNCNCVEMVDVGVYNSCSHFCKYCYANYDESLVKNNFLNHDVNSTMLVGKLNDEDTIKIRK